MLLTRRQAQIFINKSYHLKAKQPVHMEYVSDVHSLFERNINNGYPIEIKSILDLLKIYIEKLAS